MGKIQKLDWGTIEWVYEPEEGSEDHLRVGFSVMYGKTSQPRHIHYGDEQFIYILSGHGWQRINGEESLIEPGKYFHISAGTEHEAVNCGEENIVKLLISLPAVLNPPKVAKAPRAKIQKMEKLDKKEFLEETVKELYRHNLRALRVPLAIFDAENQLIYRNDEYPRFCRDCCRIEDDVENCELYCQKPIWVPPYYEGASASVCRHGLILYVLPVVFENEILGFIKTGHIRTVTKDADADEKNLPYNVPESTANGMLNMIHNIAESIKNHYQFCRMQVSLQKHSRELSDMQREEDALQEYLRTTQDKALNLQINQHFLFNTLNTLAGMAIREGAFQTYESIGDLAQLFRYTLREHENTFTTLREELGYVKNYTNLQKIRFGSSLSVLFETEDKQLYKAEVPFNFLQPIVENCFKHGFKNREQKMHIEICAGREADMLKIQVRDDGSGMTSEEREKLEEKIKTGGASHGTAMVVRKLQSVYCGAFDYRITAREGGGTCVTICIPLLTGRDYNHEKDTSGR